MSKLCLNSDGDEKKFRKPSFNMLDNFQILLLILTETEDIWQKDQTSMIWDLDIIPNVIFQSTDEPQVIDAIIRASLPQLGDDNWLLLGFTNETEGQRQRELYVTKAFAASIDDMQQSPLSTSHTSPILLPSIPTILPSSSSSLQQSIIPPSSQPNPYQTNSH
ncbi:2679_t:CDS:2 [Paraglomus brasilianum]|uniref:2679_t:CDS:1 n=1 Tax=Paraglomus brasilianum TaxID=144538 RepID=A0A9N8VUS3_9GLOM|nr:2679_t:CDS:2 [Paraglomus brasilianum]